MKRIGELFQKFFNWIYLEISKGNSFFKEKESEIHFMKKFLTFTTILQVIKWMVVSIFFIAEKPSLWFYLGAGVVEYIINIFYVKFYYKKYLYSCIISIPMIKTIIPSFVLGQKVKMRNPFKKAKPRTL